MNKVFFLAVNTGFSDDEKPDDRCIEFYRLRTGKDIYCSIVGNVLTPGGHGTNSSCLRISEDPNWEILASSIKENTTKPGIQLSTTWPSYQGVRSFKRQPSQEAIDSYFSAAASITNLAIEEAFLDLQKGTELSLRAGFRHIQLHAAHGYFFSLILDPLFSPNFELSRKLTEHWISTFKNPTTELSIRLSSRTGNQEIDKTREKTIKEILSLDFDFFDISEGFYNINKKLIYPTEIQTLAERHKLTIDIATKNPTKKIIISGRLKELENWYIPENISFGICRDLIANYNFLSDKSNGCVNSMLCHYFSRGKSHIDCKNWHISTEKQPKK